MGPPPPIFKEFRPVGRPEKSMAAFRHPSVSVSGFVLLGKYSFYRRIPTYLGTTHTRKHTRKTFYRFRLRSARDSSPRPPIWFAFWWGELPRFSFELSDYLGGMARYRRFLVFLYDVVSRRDGNRQSLVYAFVT